MTPKIVMFNMELGDAPEELAEGEEPSHNKLETMIKELSHALTGKNRFDKFKRFVKSSYNVKLLKLRKFTLTEKNFRQINYLVSSSSLVR